VPLFGGQTNAWIIQDGNYPDFARDGRAAFALEFYAAALSSK
jgi:hypothetical protein